MNSSQPSESDDLIRKLEATQSHSLDNPSVDFSEDSLKKGLSPSEQAKTDIQLEEWQHRKTMQLSVFSSGLTFAALLYIVAAIIGIIVAYGFAIGKNVDWHLTLLAAAFAIPATVIVIAIIRSVYASQKPEDGDNLPALNLIKEIIVAVKEVLSSGK